MCLCLQKIIRIYFSQDWQRVSVRPGRVHVCGQQQCGTRAQPHLHTHCSLCSPDQRAQATGPAGAGVRCAGSVPGGQLPHLCHRLVQGRRQDPQQTQVQRGSLQHRININTDYTEGEDIVIIILTVLRKVNLIIGRNCAVIINDHQQLKMM